METIIPAVLLLGGGALIYTQCVANGGNTKSTSKTSPKTTRSTTQTDEVIDENDFLTPKQRKQLQQQEERAKIQQEKELQQKVKKEAEIARKKALAEKAKIAAKEKELQDEIVTQTSPKGGKNDPKSTKQQGNNNKTTKNQQSTTNDQKGQSAAQKKKEAALREKEMEAKLLKQATQNQNITGNTTKQPKNIPQQQQKKVIVQQEDTEWTTVLTKKDRERAAKAKAKSDEEQSDVEIEDLFSTKDESETKDLQKKQPPITLRVPIDEKQRVLIIGPKGATIEEIKAKTSCWISVPKDEDLQKDLAWMYNRGPVYIKVEGPREGAELARKIIKEFAEKGFSPTLTGGMHEAKYTLEVNKRPIIIGPKGSTLETLQRVLGVKVIMPERLSNSTQVTIAGTNAGIKQCKKALDQLVTDGFSTVTHPTWKKETIDFDSSYRRRLIGRAGQVIKQLQATTRCRITFPSSDTKNSVHVIGETHNIPNAIAAIHKLVEKIELDEEEADLAASLQFNAMGDDDDYIDDELRQYMYQGDDDY